MQLQFPFSSIRGPQEELISDVRNTVTAGRHLVANAPTGMGKTVAALYPSLEYAANNGKTVFFLTSRLSQHKIAIETLKKMADADKINAVDLIGKKWLCSHDVQDMDSSMFSNHCSALIRSNQCKYYRNFKEKGEIKPEARNAITLLKSKPLHSEEAKTLVGHTFCTYELLTEAANSSDVVVADYFHIFSPHGKKFLKRMGKTLENSIIIADEAHNLPDRIRKNLSSKISTRTCDLAKREAGQFGLDVKEYIECAEEAISMTARKFLMSSSESFISKEEFFQKIEKLCGYKAASLALAQAGEKVLETRKKSHIERMAIFLAGWEGPDEGYARIISRERIMGKDHVSIFYNCMDPSLVSKPIINDSHSTILMSGTLSPMEMYRDLLGLNEHRTDLKSYSSPFPKNNRLNIITKGITTKYKERTPENFARIARTVALCASTIKGNAAVFFPSYEIMKKIRALCGSGIGKQVFAEEQGMTKEERKKLIEEFESSHQKGAVLFGVLAGSFSEGIDLPGDKLNGVIIVGIPLEKPTLFTKALTDYYDSRFKKGMEYGYIYPAMIKVMQASGRCIRTETDRGVCVFADDRFLWRNYRTVFPNDWNFLVTERPEMDIKKFFEC